MDKPETLKGALETWRYAGRRLAKGKTYHEWHFLGDPPESGWWPVKGSTTYIVGAQYEIRADRGQDGEATTMYGRPQFLRADHSAPGARPHVLVDFGVSGALTLSRDTAPEGGVPTADWVRAALQIHARHWETAAAALARGGWPYDDGYADGLRACAHQVGMLARMIVWPGSHRPAISPGPGARLIAAERLRQVTEEGWTAEHDAEHTDGQLARAAVCYAQPPKRRAMRPFPAPGPVGDRGDRSGYLPAEWPWRAGWWKPYPEDRIRELVKAGALIAAEIDRLSAAAGQP